ncbi:porin family protein [Ferruginibacter sp. SUN106]|uniref:porin family protein n=1 Tax=Ferruginibacter sp. SUN106 TaxID=2978348 RepID=UPI003D367239
MKKFFTLAVLSLIIITSSKAQISYGVQAGVNIANWQGDALNSLNSVVDLSNGFIGTKSRTGFHIGGYLSIPISEQVSFEPGLQYSQKGYAMKGDLKIDALKFLGVNASAKVEANYIDIPLIVKAEVAKGLSIYAGPQISYLAKSSLHVNTSVLGISLLNKRLDLTDNFNRMDIGIAGGVGYQFDNGFNVKAGYDYGLSKLDKNDNFKAYNRVVKLSVGFSF